MTFESVNSFDHPARMWEFFATVVNSDGPGSVAAPQPQYSFPTVMTSVGRRT